MAPTLIAGSWPLGDPIALGQMVGAVVPDRHLLPAARLVLTRHAACISVAA